MPVLQLPEPGAHSRQERTITQDIVKQVHKPVAPSGQEHIQVHTIF